MSSIEGLGALSDQLDGLEERVLEERVLEGAAEGLAQGLAQTAALARELAPVKTGTLRGSIGHAVARVGDGVEGKVGAGAKYAADVEMGGPQPAKPFLYPAFKQTEALVRNAVRQGVKRKVGDG